MLTYLAIAARYSPRWLVWENVPGVLSSNRGRDFGAFLGALGQLGYGFAYRVLDAQYFGLAQRRKRVFVVGCLGGWQRAAAVLFERASLSGHPAPRREAGKAAPAIPSRRTAGGGLGTDFDCDGGLVRSVAGSITQRIDRGGVNSEGNDGHLIPSHRISPSLLAKENSSHREDAEAYVAQVSRCISTGEGNRQDYESTTLVAFSCKDHGADVGLISPTLRSMGHDGSHANAGGQVAVAFMDSESHSSDNNVNIAPTMRTGDCAKISVAVALRGRAGGATAELGDEVGNALRASGGGGDKAHVLTAMQVRRLTPRECCRLQGFPDDYLDIIYRGKPAADGPKYKALGNSFAVPVVRWIGRRLAAVEVITQRAEVAA